MTIFNKIKLIPRNNWDYGFFALVNAITGSILRKMPAVKVESFFLTKPVWTMSGRSSLYAILKALSLSANSQVGVPLFCCPVVFDAIRQAGCQPYFLDCNDNDYNLSPEDFERKRNGLSALVAVHMFGNPCDMDKINFVAQGIPVIEDCAQSIYSKYKGRYTGFLSTSSFFSFRCGKYISAGEGSAIFCNDSNLQRKVEQVVSEFKSSGMISSIMHSFITYIKALFYSRPLYGTIGYPVGIRLDKKLNLTAKEGFEKRKIAPGDLWLANKRIPKFQKKIERQRRNAQLLNEHINIPNVILSYENKDCVWNWFQFPLRFPNSESRDAMAEHLWKNGIDSAKYLDNIVDIVKEDYGYITGDCPNAERFSKTVLLIPIHYTLKEKEIISISEIVNSCKY